MRLRRWMLEKKISVKKIAEDLVYQKAYMHKIVKESQPPGKKLADAILKYTDGKVDMLAEGYKDLPACKCPTCGK